MATGEQPGKNVLQIENKTSFFSDKAEAKDIKDIRTYLLENYEVNEGEIDLYAQQILTGAKQIANAINKKIENRKLSLANIAVSDDQLVKKLTNSANSQIYSKINELGSDINSVLAQIANNIKNTDDVIGSINTNRLSGIQ